MTPAGDLVWLGELAEPVRLLLDTRRRLAQEHVGWEFLRSVGADERSRLLGITQR
jgi:hypothetical protein